MLGECWENFGTGPDAEIRRIWGDPAKSAISAGFHGGIPCLRFPEKSDGQNEEKPMPDRTVKKCGVFSGLIRPILAFQKLPYTLFRFSARQAKFGKSGFRAV